MPDSIAKHVDPKQRPPVRLTFKARRKPTFGRGFAIKFHFKVVAALAGTTSRHAIRAPALNVHLNPAPFGFPVLPRPGMYCTSLWHNLIFPTGGDNATCPKRRVRRALTPIRVPDSPSAARIGRAIVSFRFLLPLPSRNSPRQADAFRVPGVDSPMAPAIN